MLASNRTSAESGELRTAHAPYLALVSQFDRGFEQFRLMLQSMASEGDVDKLKEVESIVAVRHKTFADLALATGNEAAKNVFYSYQAAALGATGVLLTRSDAGGGVKRMPPFLRRAESVVSD